MEAPAIAAEVLEALEAVLPEDAPAGHEAWQKVKFTSTHSWPHSRFYFGTQRFQATLGNCLTEQATQRVARACYVRFSDGDPQEKVAEFRNQIYAKIKGIQGNGAAAGDPAKMGGWSGSQAPMQ
ncbi:unnamed protein product [Prorocentrum cordatum]|nr:unnamed protein product [Polarella glacialis]